MSDNKIRFYNAKTGNWEETNATIKDLRLHGEEENKAELKDLLVTNKAKEIDLLPPGMKIVPYDIDLLYPSHEAYQAKRKAFRNKILERAEDLHNKYVPLELAARRAGMTPDQYLGLKRLMKNYYDLGSYSQVAPYANGVPFHVEKSVARTEPYKLAKVGSLATVVPLTLKNRVKMKLQGLYKTVKQIFTGKPLTAKERALKAFMKEEK